MKITCNVINDILPLYVENMLSEDSEQIVSEHLKSCELCNSIFQEMRKKETYIDNDATMLLSFKNTWKKNKMKIIFASIFLTLFILISVLWSLTVPQYFAYDENLLKIEKLSDNRLLAIFGDHVDGYEFYTTPSRTDDGVEVHLTTWQNAWSRLRSRPQHSKQAVLNINNEKVLSVYYYHANGAEDILIYGKDLIGSGGVVTLPRLALSYYKFVAVVMAIFILMIMLLFRHNKKVFSILKKLLPLPLAYICGHFAIKGMKASSYNMQRDFIWILIFTAYFYLAFIFGSWLIKNRKK